MTNRANAGETAGGSGELRGANAPDRARDISTAWVLAAVFAVSWLFRFLSTSSLHNDHYMHLAWANQVLGGDLPVRDFLDPGMPLTYLLSAAAQLVLGHGAWAEAVLSFTLLSAGAVLTCYLAHRMSGSLTVGVFASLVQVVMAPRLYSAPKIVLPLWAVWTFCRYADRPSRRRLIELVVCTVVAFLVRHDHGLYIGIAAAVLLAAVHARHAVGHLASYATLVLLALLPFFIYAQANGGIIDYLQTGLAFSRAEYTGRRIDQQPRFDLSLRAPKMAEINIRWAPAVDDDARSRLEAEHGLQAAIQVRDRTWRYNLADQSPDNVRRLVSRPEVEDTAGIDRAASRVEGVDQTLLGRMERAALERGAGWLTPWLKRENAVAWLYFLFRFLPVVVLVRLGLSRIRPDWRLTAIRVAPAVVTATAVLGLVTNEGYLRDPIDVRLADASAVTLVLAAWLAGRVGGSWAERLRQARVRRPASQWSRSAVSVVVATMVLLAVAATLMSAAELGSLHRAIEKTRLTEGPRPLLQSALQTMHDLSTRPPIEGWLATGDDRRELKELTRYVRDCTRPDDRLLVTWFAPEVYFYAERQFAGGLAFFYPGFFVSSTDEETALGRLRARSVPIVLAEVGRYESSFRRDHPLLAAHLASRYTVAGDVSTSGDERYRVLVDRQATPVRTASPWSLPCFR
jgi:hypothetical protein